MTREEALVYMELYRLRLKGSVGDLSEDIKAYDMAIAALQAEPSEDCVNRADTLQSFESYCEKNCQFSKKQRDIMCRACMMGDAIEIVESLPSVTPKPLDTVLDEIKEEIFLLSDSKCNGNSVTIYSWSGMQRKVFDIIDRYKAEGSEEGESK